MIKTYIKKVGTGPSGHRDLSQEEARSAAELILRGEASPAQTGALLLGLRLKGETEAEIGGFLSAIRGILATRPPVLPDALPEVDLDIGDPYDGRSRSTSHIVASALLASRTGLRIGLHGLSGVPVKMGPGVLEAWKSLGLPDGAPAISGNVACLSQEDFLPELSRLLPLRRELGLRTIWNTVEKAANPLSAPAQIIGVFHEPVVEKIFTALMAQESPPRRLLITQGVEGSTDLHPHRETVCHLFDRALSPELRRLTIPAAPTEGIGLSHPDPSLGSNLDIGTHIHALRQAALFLFAAGQQISFDSALALIESVCVHPSPGRLS